MKVEVKSQIKKWGPVGILVLALALLGYYTHTNSLQLEREKNDLLAKIDEKEEERLELLRQISEKEEIINQFEGQIGSIASTVGTLEKLSKTDEELLQKYSKVYFLNENYRPAQLSNIELKYLFAKDDAYIHTNVKPYLERLLRDAKEEGYDLRILSAFRSFESQASLKSAYKVTYGSGANTFSADQGYSEHQLGTAVDFTTPNIGALLSGFDKEKVYEWLLDEAHNYGFILSYPQGNKFYKFEPWHWRFVGVSLATKLYEENKHFYDLDQREIDEYLVEIFD